MLDAQALPDCFVVLEANRHCERSEAIQNTTLFNALLTTGLPHALRAFAMTTVDMGAGWITALTDSNRLCERQQAAWRSSRAQTPNPRHRERPIGRVAIQKKQRRLRVKKDWIAAPSATARNAAE